MNTLLKQPEPATSPTAREETPARSDTVPALRLSAVQSRARILYVDDEPQLRRLGELVLVRSGYEVDTAANGAEAWAALHDREYHLLITDHDMPRITGMELAAMARHAGMRLPIMMTTGSVTPLRDPACVRLGLAACLQKPFDVNLLVQTVGQVLRAANDLHQGSGSVISVVAHLRRSVQPFPHGGINE